MSNATDTLFENAPIDRDRDVFLREMISQLADVLEKQFGLQQAEGFIALVGNRVGNIMHRDYAEAAGTDSLTKEQLAAALVDLKKRIEGGFSVESITDDEIILTNTACPFGDYVKGHEALCMMTSNVFGRIAANANGYARVALEETIARGDKGCRVVVSFKTGEHGREYFG